MIRRIPPYHERALFLLREQAKQWPLWLIHAVPVMAALIGECSWKPALITSVFLMIVRPLYGALGEFEVVEVIDEIEF